MNWMSLGHTFENFKMMPGTEAAFQAFKELAENENPKPFLLCVGRAGNGKTYLCDALSIALYKRGIRCAITIWPEFVRSLKKAMRQSGQSQGPSYDDLFEKVQRKPYLIVDDVGLGTVGSEWEWGELEDIISYRYRERLMTVLTSNLDITGLPERIVSRFSDSDIGVIVVNKGRDYRLLKSRGKA